MRADKMLMLGVVALGGYAVYRLVRAPGGPSPAFDRTAPGDLPEIPGPLPVPPAGSTVLPAGPTMHLRKGAWYRGRLEISASAPQRFNAREEIESELQRLGFSSLPGATRVFMSPEEAMNASFSSWSLPNPGRGTRWFLARWAGETIDVPRPPAMVLVYQSFPPSR